MNYRPLIITISFIFLFSACLSNDSQKKENTFHEKDSLQSAQALKETSYRKIGLPFDVDSLKKVWEENTTSTVLNDKFVQHLYKPDHKGFYGGYSLLREIKDSDGLNCLGGAVFVYAQNYPWFANDTTEVFIGFKTQHKGISVYDYIQIGSSVDDLKSLFGDPHLYSDTVIAYRGDDDYVGIFSCNSKKELSRIFIGKMNKPFFDNFEENVLSQTNKLWYY